jgi:hypothetical protein
MLFSTYLQQYCVKVYTFSKFMLSYVLCINVTICVCSVRVPTYFCIVSKLSFLKVLTLCHFIAAGGLGESSRFLPVSAVVGSKLPACSRATACHPVSRSHLSSCSHGNGSLALNLHRPLSSEIHLCFSFSFLCL